MRWGGVGSTRRAEGVADLPHAPGPFGVFMDCPTGLGSNEGRENRRPYSFRADDLTLFLGGSEPRVAQGTAKIPGRPSS